MKKGLNKNIIIIAVAVLVILSIAIYLFFFVLSPKLPNQDVLNDPAKAMDSCSKLSNDKQAGCYFQIADILKTNNTDFALQACLAISNEQDKKNCVGKLASEQTDQNKAQLLMCESQTGLEKDNCYMGIAQNFLTIDPSKSVEICNKMSDKSLIDSCLNNIIRNPEIIKANISLAISICDSLTLKSNCYSYIANIISAINPKQASLICQKLGDDVQISDCYGNSWFSFNNVVIQNYDFTISLCNFLTLKKDDCLRRTMGVFMNIDKSKAIAACSLISSINPSDCSHIVQGS